MSSTDKILISACLLGRPVRYNGKGKRLDHVQVALWREAGRLVAICPELSGGFAVPRPPAEIANGGSGEAVLAGAGRVVDNTGADVTGQFIAGAEAALALARQHDCRFALLIDGSPSCGSASIYDGKFDGGRHEAAGVTAALLRQNGIAVFTEREVEALAAAVDEAG